MAWCFSNRASVAIVWIMPPCISNCLWVKLTKETPCLMLTGTCYGVSIVFWRQFTLSLDFSFIILRQHIRIITNEGKVKIYLPDFQNYAFFICSYTILLKTCLKSIYVTGSLKCNGLLDNMICCALEAINIVLIIKFPMFTHLSDHIYFHNSC